MYTGNNKIEQATSFHENATPRWQVFSYIFHPYSSGLKTTTPWNHTPRYEPMLGEFLPQSEQDVQILQVSGEEHKKEEKNGNKRTGDLPEKNKVSG